MLLILIRSGKSCSHISPHVREYGFRNPENVACENRNVTKFCLLESGIPGFGIRNPAQEISPTIRLRDLSSIDKESRIHGSESRIQDCLGSESRTVLDSLIWGDTFSSQAEGLMPFWLISARVGEKRKSPTQSIFV